MGEFTLVRWGRLCLPARIGSDANSIGMQNMPYFKLFDSERKSALIL
jgi:hypothetical protein